MPLWVACTVLLATLVQTATAQVDVEAGSGHVTIEVGGGAGLNGWFTADDDDSEGGVGHAIDHHVAGIWFAEARAAASVDEVQLVGVALRRALAGAPAGSPGGATPAATDKTLFGMDAFLDLAFLAARREGLGYQLLSGLRLDYRLDEFQGPATAVEQTAYLDSNGAITPFDPGDAFTVRARFADLYLGLVRLGDPEGPNVRLGVYWSELEKPHEPITHQLATGGRALVVDTRISGRGGFTRFTTGSVDLLLRLGGTDFETQSGDAVPGLFAGEKGYAGLLSFAWRPRINLGQSGDVALFPHLGLMFRLDFLDSPTQSLSADDSELSMDIQADIGLGLRWSWGLGR